jgi:hypothetical protein
LMRRQVYTAAKLVLTSPGIGTKPPRAFTPQAIRAVRSTRAVTCRACWFSGRVRSRSRCDQADPRAPSPWRWCTHGLIRAMTQVLRGNRDCDQMVQTSWFPLMPPCAGSSTWRSSSSRLGHARCDATRRAADRSVPALRSRRQRPRRLVVGRPVQDAVEVVLKAVLRCEPLLDLAGDCGCCACSEGAIARAGTFGSWRNPSRAARRCCCSRRAPTSAGRWRNAISETAIDRQPSRGGQSFKAVPHTVAAQW